MHSLMGGEGGTFNEIVIGVGDPFDPKPGGEGTVYIDDIVIGVVSGGETDGGHGGHH